MSGTRRWLVPIAAMLVLAATACSKGGGGIGTTLSEYKIELSSESASAGEVTFDVTNNGEKVHEFLVLKTDLAADALPTKEEVGTTVVDEEGAEGLELIDEVEDVAPGSDASLTVELEAGSYVLLCNVAGHYEEGMFQAFTVS